MAQASPPGPIHNALPVGKAHTPVSDHAAARIRELRQFRNLTQEELAARCEEMGAGYLTRNVIVRIEQPRTDLGFRRSITVDDLYLLADALGVSIHQLLPPAPSANFDPDLIRTLFLDALDKVLPPSQDA